MEYILIESLKHDSFRTQWEAWVLELAEAVRQTDIRIPRTWTILKPLSENIQAMIWLTEKLRKLQSAPSFHLKTRLKPRYTYWQVSVGTTECSAT